MNLRKEILRTRIKAGNNNYYSITGALKQAIEEHQYEQIIENIPLMCELTGVFSYPWINEISKLFNNKDILNVFIDNLDKIPASSLEKCIYNILKVISVYKLTNEECIKLLNKILNLNYNYTNICVINYLYLIIFDNYKDYIPTMLISLLTNKKYTNSTLEYINSIINTHDYTYLFKDNLDLILQTNTIDLFYLKDLLGEDYKDIINNEITINSKLRITALVNKCLLNRLDYHSFSELEKNTINSSIEIIYLVIKDICANENIDITDIKQIGDGSFSTALLIGEKVFKFGVNRNNDTFSNNPYIVAPLLRKKIEIDDLNSIFIEVCERVDTNTKIDENDLYEIYKKVRDIGLIWTDVLLDNVGILLKDNKRYWRKNLPVSDGSLGLQPYIGGEQLKKGDIVIIDADFIYDENDPEVEYDLCHHELCHRFENQYQKSKELINKHR
ncbi:MAG: hypothetical protein IJ574_01385 [Bacilli bacterium]|nr:hypothetical protein [Bacilli bacterium]